MDPIAPGDRAVVNVAEGAFEQLRTEVGKPDGWVLQVNGGRRGHGFHLYRMAPGETTQAHVHRGDEEFYLIEGDLTDHDGYEYKPGDLVCLRSGTRHNSHSRNGCTLVVLLRDEDDV